MMWRLAFRVMQPMSVLTADKAKVFWNINAFKYTIVPVACTSIYYFLHHDQHCYPLDDDIPEHELFFSTPKKNGIIETAKSVIRFIELGIIFTPSLVCLPLYLFQSTRGWWLTLFLHAVQKAGIVWIKAFQYLSHRRDIIGEDMARKFEVLRENCPQHQFSKTVQTIQRVYGKAIDEMFEQFNTTPIASGSVSQVYSAKLNGKKVAVKVRHPQVGHNLSRDIDLMFGVSRFLSFFSKFFEIPVTHQSLKRILSEQLSFLKQKQNIDRFNRVVVDNNLFFPITYPESTNEVLIEQFIEGRTISSYEAKDHGLNKVIANLGAKAFFAMLMKYNFVHADCHGGNILVRIKDQSNQVTRKARNVFNKAKNYLISQFIKYGFDSEFLRRLSEENYEYEKDIAKLVEKYKEKVEIILIDVGMTVSLTPEKKKNFTMFLEEVIKGDPLECAKWIYRVSLVNGAPLKENENMIYFNDLHDMFQRVHKTALDSLQGIEVLKEMLEVVRKHNIKIDGQISILLTNILVLESMAKDLDPTINILRCAVPYLHYK